MTEQAVVIITVAVILLVMVFSFTWPEVTPTDEMHLMEHSPQRHLRGPHRCRRHRFRRKDIEFVEPSFDEDSATVSVRVGNLQRMVWIDFPDEAQALEFVALMERKLARKE